MARAETRLDPILPVVVSSVREPPDAQLPLLELVDAHGIPTTARGRGAPLDLAVYIAACILTPPHLRESDGKLVTTVR